MDDSRMTPAMIQLKRAAVLDDLRDVGHPCNEIGTALAVVAGIAKIYDPADAAVVMREDPLVDSFETDLKAASSWLEAFNKAWGTP